MNNEEYNLYLLSVLANIIKPLDIKYIETDKLIPYDNNARVNDEAVEFVVNSINEFGFKNPIIIDEDNVIIAGHTRLKAAQKLGLEKVPCVIVTDLSEDKIKALRIADNSTGQIAQWDMDKLMKELDSIDMDMSQFGLKEQMNEIEDILDSYRVAKEDDYEIPEELEPRVKYGEVWQLGNHRLMCGDSTKEEDVKKLMKGKVADLVVTDPPYNVNISNSDGLTIENDNMSNEEFTEFLNKAFKNLNDNLKEGGAFYIWYASRNVINFQTALENAGLFVKQELIWNKNSLVMGRQDYQWKHEPCLYGWKDGASHYFVDDRTQTTVIDETRPSKCDLHPTMKPIKLISRLIKNSSKKNDIVLDEFGGSGTTLVSCEQLDRICYMLEYDPFYATVIIDRWEKLTGKKAVKIE